MSKIVNIEEEKRKEKKKKTLMNIIFTVTAVYIIYAIYLIAKTPTDTIRVENDTLTLEESTTGYIIRNEKVVQGDNYKNGIYPIVSEGKRAAKNQTIFRYYGKNEDELQQKISDIDLKIQEALQKEKFPTDIKNLEIQIDDAIKNLNAKNDLQDISECKKKLSNIILKKATIAGENSKSGSYIKGLVEQREQYEDQLIQDSEYVETPVSGVVSYRVDGLENVLSSENFEELSSKSLEDLDLKTGKIVPSSDESAKIIDNFACYIAVKLNSTAAKNAKVGQNVKITLYSGDEIPAVIEHINVEDNNKILIVFKLNALTEELISYRKISLNITWWSIMGIKVPNSAILEDDDSNKYVVKKTSSDEIKCLIKVLNTNGKYSIISSYSSQDLENLNIDISTYKGVDVYDVIMLHPK